MSTLFGLYLFLLTLYADGGYQGPNFRDGLRRVLRSPDAEIVNRTGHALPHQSPGYAHDGRIR